MRKAEVSKYFCYFYSLSVGTAVVMFWKNKEAEK